jgi:hypothetical protein
MAESKTSVELERILKRLRMERMEFEWEVWIPFGAVIVAGIVAGFYGAWK